MSGRYRIVIWGPGEVGGAVARAAHSRPEFELVGAKVFSPHKHGRDLGELVGIGPVGVTATTSREEVIGLDADCVVFTPDARSIADGMDDDVIALLESGKNVIATSAYHNVTMSDPDPTHRASASRLAQACRSGGVSLLGTGVHPSFMVERVALTMSQALTDVSHIRIVEALDFSLAPEGMWGGLDNLGFGRDPSELDGASFIAGFGDLYYPKIAGSVAHSLYGAATEDVRIERELIGLPSEREFKLHSTVVEQGNVAGLHLIHRGFLGERLFYTNEEIWYLGPGGVHRGADLPFDGFRGPLCYTLEISGSPANLRTQLEWDITGTDNPITNTSVQVVLDAVAPVCAADPGILIDDPTPRYRLDDRLGTA